MDTNVVLMHRIMHKHRDAATANANSHVHPHIIIVERAQTFHVLTGPLIPTIADNADTNVVSMLPRIRRPQAVPQEHVNSNVSMGVIQTAVQALIQAAYKQTEIQTIAVLVTKNVLLLALNVLADVALFSP